MSFDECRAYRKQQKVRKYDFSEQEAEEQLNDYLCGYSEDETQETLPEE